VIADDPAGPFVGVLDAGGNFSVKQGFIGGWTLQAGNVKQIAIADDPGGPVIGALDSLGNFSVKQGITGAWTSEGTNVARMAISG
jgi:hypothetical protein